MKISHNDDIVWTPMKTLNNDLAENIPTRSATNTHCILPIIQGIPTGWSNL